jgi:hypothetical protein
MLLVERETEHNFSIFRECLSETLISELSAKSAKPKKRAKRKARLGTRARDTTDAAEDNGIAGPEDGDPGALKDFVDVWTPAPDHSRLRLGSQCWNTVSCPRDIPGTTVRATNSILFSNPSQS